MVANYSTAFYETEKLNIIQREGKRIYKNIFRTSLIDSFHAAAYDPPLKLGLRF